MLAKPGRPFDSDEHLFEIKWDGTRALAFVERSGPVLKNRRGEDLGARFPELAGLPGIPPGTVLDGEIVVLKDGRVDFGLAMARVHARGALRIGGLARATPATYVVFDQLYEGYGALLERPLEERRERLRRTVAAAGEERLVLSDGVVGAGQAYYDEVTALGIEGVVAKELASRYQPGRRTGAWTKCKREQTLLCAIIGYVPEGEDDLASLIVAADFGGELTCVGRVGSGLSGAFRRDLVRRLRSRPRDAPVVAVGFPGRWVEPGLYCTVRFLERTGSGMLRAPVFVALVEDA
jgi:bifunctional non-homologous end joining protein LigD